MRSLALAVVVILIVVATALGVDEFSVSDPSSKWKLQVDLIDGSRIVGDPEIQILELDVKFDRLEIPLQRVRHAQWLKDPRWVRVELKNRDVITGKILAKQIGMSTIFGDVVLKTSQMKSLEVIPADRLAGLPSQRDLVLYYSFDRDGGTHVVNHAADQLHGKATNVRWVSEGRRGGAVAFDGNASIEIPHHKHLCPATLTMAAWIHPNALGGSYEMVMAKTDGGSWNQGYGLVRRSGEPNHLTFFVNSYSSSGAMVKAEIGKWSHIAGIFDGENVSVYLNGQLAQTAKVPGTTYGEESFDRGEGETDQPRSRIRHTATPMFLGRNPSGYTWAGKMDELVIYSRALEPTEIKRLYMAGAAR